MNSNLIQPNNEDVLLLLRKEKAELRKKIRESQRKMSEASHAIFSPIPHAKSKVEGMSHLVGNGLVIWNGVKIGISLVNAFRNLFGHKKSRR